jgi:hypothetical protein
MDDRHVRSERFSKMIDFESMVSFICSFSPQFDTVAVERGICALERSVVPNVDWEWRFAALSPAAGPWIDVRVTVPSGKPVHFYAPCDTDGALFRARKWFSENRPHAGNPDVERAFDLLEIN